MDFSFNSKRSHTEKRKKRAWSATTVQVRNKFTCDIILSEYEEPLKVHFHVVILFRFSPKSTGRFEGPTELVIGGFCTSGGMSWSMSIP